MKIAYSLLPERGDADLLLAEIAETLVARALRVRGIVQINSLLPDRARCDMDVRVLPHGPVIRISQSLGAGAGACRLDAGALESAVGLVAASLEHGADILILNKFGKQEAAGRGFLGLIAEAASREIPVLLRVNHGNLAAFRAFTAGLATELAPHAAEILGWVDNALSDTGTDRAPVSSRVPGARRGGPVPADPVLTGAS